MGEFAKVSTKSQILVICTSPLIMHVSMKLGSELGLGWKYCSYATSYSVFNVLHLGMRFDSKISMRLCCQALDLNRESENEK